MKAEEVLALVGGHVDDELLLRNEYLAAENEILRSKLPARVPLTDDERIRLAKLGKRLGKKALMDVAAIVAPETILSWYWRLVAKKVDGSANRGRIGRPREEWMRQVARNATMADWGFLSGCTHLIFERDFGYCASFQSILESAGIKMVRLPPRSPNLNEFAERFVRSAKEECLPKFVFFSEGDLRRAMDEFLVHYHKERNHQGKGNVLLFPCSEPTEMGPVRCRERLGGLLKFYWREAA